MSDIVERLQSHMGKADMGEVLSDCRKAAEEIERLRKALEQANKSIRNARGAIESNQVIDKDVHGTLSRAISAIEAALEDKRGGGE